MSGATLAVGCRLIELVLDCEAADACKLFGIAGDKWDIQSESVGGDEKVVWADRRARCFELGTDTPIMDVGGLIERD